MKLLAAIIGFEARFFLFALMGVVAYKMLTGRIITVGLLMNKVTGANSPARIQLLFFTLAGAVFYLGAVAMEPAGFPDLPTELFAILGGSNLAFLGSKGVPRLLSFVRKFMETKT